MDKEMIERLTNILLKHNPQTKIGAIIVVVELIKALREPTDKMLIEMEDAEPNLYCFLPKEQSPSYKVWQAAINAIINE